MTKAALGARVYSGSPSQSRDGAAVLMATGAVSRASHVFVTESVDLNLNWKWAMSSKVNYFFWLAHSSSASMASPDSITAGDQTFRSGSLRWAHHVQTLACPIGQNDSSIRYIHPSLSPSPLPPHAPVTTNTLSPLIRSTFQFAHVSKTRSLSFCGVINSKMILLLPSQHLATCILTGNFLTA